MILVAGLIALTILVLHRVALDPRILGSSVPVLTGRSFSFGGLGSMSPAPSVILDDFAKNSRSPQPLPVTRAYAVYWKTFQVFVCLLVLAGLASSFGLTWGEVAVADAC